MLVARAHIYLLKQRRNVVAEITRCEKAVNKSILVDKNP